MRFIAAILGVFVLMGGIAYGLFEVTRRHEEVVKRIEVVAAPPEGPLSGAVEDDTLQTKVKRRLNFEANRVHPVKLEDTELNLSSAVISLDLDLINAEEETVFARNYRTFKDAAEAARGIEGVDNATILPSASLLFHKARALDSGLLATIDLAMANGDIDRGIGLVGLVKEIFKALEPTDQARAYLAAALDLAGQPVELFPEEVSRRNIWITRYQRRRVVYPPIDYYAWNEQLERVYDFETFLQEPIPRRNWFMAAQIARALKKEENRELLNAYRFFLAGFDFLYMPRQSYTIAELTNYEIAGDESFLQMFRDRQGMTNQIVFLPPARRREQIHYREMLPLGVVAGLNTFSELTQRSMIGRVSFVPRSGRPGIEQYHAMALDAILVEQRSLEADKLLLSRTYRERLFHPYRAIKRDVLETELDSIVEPVAWKPSRPGMVRPILRVEPVPQYYLRSARSYQYMSQVMQRILGARTTESIRRVLPNGNRQSEPLAVEVNRLKRLLYGTYMVTCEDLGIEPNFDPGDVVNQEQCYEEAIAWLEDAYDDADAALDARYMSPPVRIRVGDRNPNDRIVETWSNVGVQLIKLNASFADPPSVRGLEQGSIWSTPEPKELGTSHYIMPSLYFANLELVNRGGLETETFREICDDADQELEEIRSALLALDPPVRSRFATEAPVSEEEVKESAEENTDEP